MRYNADNSYLFVNGKEVLKFKGDNRNVNFLIQFSLGSISNGYSTTDSREVPLSGNESDCSVDYNSVYKYLMTKNNTSIKQN